MYADTFGFEWNYFSKTQLDSANGTTQSRDTFIVKTGWTLEELRGKKILDAGCGMGRFSEIATIAGAEVYAVDLSSAVEAARENLKQFENVRVFQADIFNLPFFDETFDYIFSIGVLYHTPSTEKAFKALTRLLKTNGKISIWVYSKNIHKLGWMRSQLYRKITTRLSEELLLMKLCRIAGPLYYVHRIPIFGKVSHFFLPISIHSNLEWRILDTFDWYSPKYQWKHTYGELEQWFKDEKLEILQRISVPVGLSGIRK